MATRIESLNQVKAILSGLNMPKVNEPAMREISNSSKKAVFLKLLANAEDGDRRSSEELRTICECISDVAISCLATIGIKKIEIPKLVDIALGDKASLFRSLINSANADRGTDKEVAITKIYDFLGLERPRSEQGSNSNNNHNNQSHNRNINSNSSGAGEGMQRQSRPNGNANGYANNQTRGESQQPSNQNTDRSQASAHHSDAGREQRQQQQRQQQPNRDHHNERSPRPADNVKQLEDYRQNQSSSGTGGSTMQSDYEEMGFFSSSFACKFNKVVKDDKQVLRLDFATGSNRNYDWSKKISFQCSCDEMIFMYGVLIGKLPGWKSEMHASPSNKSVKKSVFIEKQEDGYFISGSSTEHKPHGVKIQFKQSALLKAFVYLRVKTWFGDCSDALIHKWIEEQCSHYTYEKHAQRGQRA